MRQISVLVIIYCISTFVSHAHGETVAGWAADAPDVSSLVRVAHDESDLRIAINRYVLDKAAIKRRYPVQYSPVRTKRLDLFFRDWQANLANVDFETLNREGQIDYVALKNVITYDIDRLRLTRARGDEVGALLTFAEPLRLLIEARLDRIRVVPRDAATTLDAIEKEIKALVALLAKGERPRGWDSAKAVVAWRSTNQIEHLRTELAEWNTFYAGYDPMFNFWVTDPYSKLDAALASLAAAIEEHIIGIRPGQKAPIFGDPVGEEGLQADLTVEMIPYSAEELIRIGEKEFEWIENQLRLVSRDMGYGDDWLAALEHTKNLAPPPGEKPWVIFDIADYSESFIEGMDSITLPPLSREVWRLAMQTPEQQLQSPFFTGGEVTRVSYPTASMAHADKLMSMRGNTPHFNFATVHHELVPGHHMQGFMTDRFNSHRGDLLRTPFWGEGWALYWELQLWDAGFPRNDPDKIGMLFWRLHRAARIIFSLNYHLGRWDTQQSVDFLVERVGHERANAEAEVRRSAVYVPLYQVAYMIGGLQFRALYKELVESGKMSARDFHDAVMMGGRLPVELVRARLTGQAMAPDYVAKWRFYDD